LFPRDDPTHANVLLTKRNGTSFIIKTIRQFPADKLVCLFYNCQKRIRKKRKRKRGKKREKGKERTENREQKQ